MQLRAILRDDKYHTEVVQSDRVKEFRKTLLEKMEDDAYLREERDRAYGEVHPPPSRRYT